MNSTRPAAKIAAETLGIEAMNMPCLIFFSHEAERHVTELVMLIHV